MLAPALGAFDRALVQVVEARCAALAGALGTPVRLDHAGISREFRKNRPNRPRGSAYVTRLSPCQNQIPACYEDAAPHFRRPSWRAALSARASTAKLVARPVARLQGRVRVPGDKSISHRALMLGALAVGETTVHGLLEGEDVLRTAAAHARARRRGRRATATAAGASTGVGVGGLAEPDDVLDLGNSGTGARLLIGHRWPAIRSPASSPATPRCARRPMARVIEPLSRMGARFVSARGRPPAARRHRRRRAAADRLPPAGRLGAGESAVLLAGLNTPGETTVIEPEPTRDHTERMLRHFGAEVRVEADRRRRPAHHRRRPAGADRPATSSVPGDPSSAAFPVGRGADRAGLATSRSTDVGLNPLRTGLYRDACARWAPTSPSRTRARRAASRSPISRVAAAR